MREHKSFLIACLFAATAPLWNGVYGAGSVDADEFPGWPAQLEGRSLEPRAIDAVELRLAEHFPGRVGRFSDGVDEWILRWIAEPTRELHSAADCYRGLGYRIEGEGIVRDDSGREWGAFEAVTRHERLRVFERIESADGHAWTDKSSWYWATVTGTSRGPWWAKTRVTVLRND